MIMIMIDEVLVLGTLRFVKLEVFPLIRSDSIPRAANINLTFSATSVNYPARNFISTISC